MTNLPNRFLIDGACFRHRIGRNLGKPLMSNTNKNNLVYFESSSVRKLYVKMKDWQKTKRKRLLSVSVQKDGDKFCCIALTNPTEVTIVNQNGIGWSAGVDSTGRLQVSSKLG